MKILIKDFQDKLAMVKEVTAGVKLPQYENILIIAENGKVQFRATSGDLSYVGYVEDAVISQEGRVCMNAARFCALANLQTEIYSTSDEKINLRIGKGKYNISGTSWKNFPQIPDIPSDGLDINHRTLLRTLIYSVCYEKDHEIVGPFSSVRLNIKDGSLTAVSTNKIQFSYYKQGYEGNGEFTIPSDHIGTIKKFINTAQREDFKVSSKGGHFTLFSDQEAIICNLIAIPYPDVSQVMIKKDDVAHSFTIGKEVFKSSLERLLNSADQVSGEVSLNLVGNVLTMNAKNSMVDGGEEMEVETHIPSRFNLNFNGFTLLKFISTLDNPITVKVNTAENRIQMSNNTDVTWSVAYLTTCLVKKTVEVVQ